ncbi:hypothetical protein [Sporosarcina sp. ITBMC105]
MTKFNVGDKARMIRGENTAFMAKIGDTATIIGRLDDDGQHKVEYETTSGGRERGWLKPSSMEPFEQYRTEKRKARVGERILIANAFLTGDHYADGDVFEVAVAQKDDDFRHGGVYVVGHGRFIRDSEYEVIVAETPVTPVAPNLAERVTELELRVAELETQLAVKSVASPYTTEDLAQAITLMANIGKTPTPNARRAAVIKQAREFVADDSLKKGRNGTYVINYEQFTDKTKRNTFIKGSIATCVVKFEVNAEKRTVVALMFGEYTGKLRAKAIAKCAPDDVFNADIGKAIALARALGMKVPAEFLNAPKPTEFAVGQVTKGSSGLNFGKVTEIRGGKAYTTWGSFWNLDSMKNGNAIILDDTDAQYEVAS